MRRQVRVMSFINSAADHEKVNLERSVRGSLLFLSVVIDVTASHLISRNNPHKKGSRCAALCLPNLYVGFTKGQASGFSRLLPNTSSRLEVSFKVFAVGHRPNTHMRFAKQQRSGSQRNGTSGYWHKVTGCDVSGKQRKIWRVTRVMWSVQYNAVSSCGGEVGGKLAPLAPTCLGASSVPRGGT